jgi:small multidrug resistance family-3 protein
LKEGKHRWLGAIGGVILAMYGVVATLQPANFGRVYAAYGGVFMAMAVLWGWKVERIKPDKWDVIGAVIAFIGMAIIMFASRK